MGLGGEGRIGDDFDVLAFCKDESDELRRGSGGEPSLPAAKSVSAS